MECKNEKSRQENIFMMKKVKRRKGRREIATYWTFYRVRNAQEL